ncbi:MAG: ketoacyl-ACP synthase III [Verrucomicrobia bacterium]|nr:ketoacyl-ACP synthase III [Verrucomicrobiota bacterium]MBT7068184.1 ketoacyl-ACP synthase III [Verrucomicrobiota bacterium]MBT7701872.1 ketoacyl-ACP synthase III [Verrucomicrobiota bacterium]
MAEADRHVGILGTGSYLPEKVLTNADLERMVDTTDEWITTRTGIKERHIAADDETVGDMGAAAARQALANAGIGPESIDLIIVATITPDSYFPSTACQVQHKLGIKNVPSFDLSAACSGFVYGFSVAEQFIKGGSAKHVLVVAAEKLSAITDWSDRSTCVLFGDGAGAAVLGPVESGGILGTHLGADGSGGDLLYCRATASRSNGPHGGSPTPSNTLQMQGNVLFKHAVRLMTDAALTVIKPLGLTAADIKLIIPHQANSRILNAVAKRLGIDPQTQLYLNLEKRGNMSAASTAIALAEAVEEGRMKRGDIILLDAFGGGLTWGAMAIQW